MTDSTLSPGDLDTTHNGCLLFFRRIEPRRHVPAGNDERMPLGYREGIPNAPDQLILVEDSICRRVIERTIHHWSRNTATP